jgi:hypothetical protein
LKHNETRRKSDKYKCGGTLGERGELWRNVSRPSNVIATVYSPRRMGFFHQRKRGKDDGISE